MKKALIVLISMFVGLAAHATKFKDDMKAMGGDYKQLVGMMKSVTPSAQILPVVMSFEAKLTTAIAEVETGFENQSDINDVRKQLNQILELIQQLKEALQQDDRARVGDLFQKISNIRRDGHDKYKKD